MFTEHTRLSHYADSTYTVLFACKYPPTQSYIQHIQILYVYSRCELLTKVDMDASYCCYWRVMNVDVDSNR